MNTLNFARPLTNILSLFAAPRTDRAEILVGYLIEDFAHPVNRCLTTAPFIARATRSADPANSARPAGEHTFGPGLDAPQRARLRAEAVRLGLTRAEADEWFAEYWLTYTVLSAYILPLHHTGWNLIRRLSQLDSLTQRASHLVPRWQLPGLECLAVTDHSLVIRRRSDRPRAAQFIFGLLRRLAADMGETVCVEEAPEFGGSAWRVTMPVARRSAEGGWVDDPEPAAPQPAPSPRRLRSVRNMIPASHRRTCETTLAYA